MNGHSGVTLVELLVVIALLGLVVGLSGLALASLRPRHSADAARVVERGRSEAIRSGRQVVVSLAPDTGHVLFLPDGRVVGSAVDPLTGGRRARR